MDRPYGGRTLRGVSVTNLLATVCTAIAMALIWPQVVRVYRVGSVQGLSTIGTLHGLASATLWASYGVAEGLVPVILANVGIWVAVLLVAFAQIRHGVLRPAHLALVLLAVGAVAAGSLATSVVLTGWLATVVADTSIVPQVVVAARAFDLTAVSIPMYAMMATGASLWVAYGALLGDTLLVVNNAWFVPCASFVAWRAWRSRQRTGLVASAPVGAVAA